MNVKLTSSGLEINIAKWLKTADFRVGKLNKDTAITSKPLKVGMALLIQTRVHFFDLKIRHIVHAPAQCAFMSSGAAELKTFDKTARWKHLAWAAHNFGKTHITGKYTDYMSAAGYPDKCFVFVAFKLPAAINLK